MSTQPNQAFVTRFTDTLLDGYAHYISQFTAITRQAQYRFTHRDWSGMRKDTIRRIDLYAHTVADTADRLKSSFGKAVRDRNAWKRVKRTYMANGMRHRDCELAATFFNSVNRKLFSTVGIDRELTFDALPPRAFPDTGKLSFFKTGVAQALSPAAIQELFKQYEFQAPFPAIADNAAQCASRLVAISRRAKWRGPFQIELLAQPFYRGMSAYLVGRIHSGGVPHPLIFALNHDEGGIYVDAVLTRPEEIRIMFSFSRAYFHVDVTHPSALVAYLSRLIPGKRIAELYIGLGFHKHGKTELYRDLLNHQKVCGQDRFDFSPGKRGMVMIAFNMSRDDLLYKLIRDRFDSPKKTTARQVMEKYDYVFKHDRAGRLLDVQTFEHLELDICCFTTRLLEEIRSEATHSVTITDDRVVLHLAYVERRVTPLDLYLQTAGEAEAEAAVIEFGNAIKDLARINVFPGDMLLKNFGVTSLGRVVFYDYDELCPLTDCRFRKIPPPRTDEEALSDEPWYAIGDHDVFPEEFRRFLGLPPHLKRVFLEHHGDLLEPQFWKSAQHHIRLGTWFHIRPYGAAARLAGATNEPSAVDNDNRSLTI